MFYWADVVEFGEMWRGLTATANNSSTADRWCVIPKGSGKMIVNESADGRLSISGSANRRSPCVLPGSAGGPEGHSGLPESHRGPPSSQGDHLPGRAAAPGGGQPAVWLGLAGDAESRHPAGEEGGRGGAAEHLVVFFQLISVSVFILSFIVIILWHFIS